MASVRVVRPRAQQIEVDNGNLLTVKHEVGPFIQIAADRLLWSLSLEDLDKFINGLCELREDLAKKR